MTTFATGETNLSLYCVLATVDPSIVATEHMQLVVEYHFLIIVVIVLLQSNTSVHVHVFHYLQYAYMPWYISSYKKI